MSRDRLVFRQLDVRRMPGFARQGFRLDGLSPGVNVIQGPNASGKTTSARALAWLLWPPTADDGRVQLAAELEIAGEPWTVELEGRRARSFQHGRPAPLPLLPPASVQDRYRLSLEPLLGADDAPLAEEILRELAGGYDLARASEAADFRKQPTRPRNLIEELRRAEEAVRTAQARQETLAREAERLARLEQERAAARQAAATLERYRTALAAVRSRAKLVEARERLAGYPEAFSLLSHDSDERLATLEARLDKARRLVREAEAEAATARAQLEREGPLDPLELEAALVTLRVQLDELQQLELRREEAERTGAAARATASQAASALGVAAGASVRPLAASDLERLSTLLRRSEELRAAETLASLGRAELGGGEAPALLDPRRHERAAELLRGWLATPGARLGSAGLWLQLLTAGAALGAALQLWRLGSLAWLPSSLACCALLWLAARSARGSFEQGHRRRDFETLGLPLPGAWRPAEVAARLSQLENELDDARDLDRRRRLWANLHVDAGAIARLRDELEAERSRLAQATGLAPHEDELRLARFAERLAALAQAQDRLAEAEAERDHASERREALLAEVSARLAHLGEAPVPDRPSAVARLRALEARAGRVSSGRLRLESLEHHLASALRPQLEEAEEALAEFWTRLGLPTTERATLARWLVELERYRKLQEEIGFAERDLAAARAALGAEAALTEAAEAELEARLAAARDAAALDASLAEQIGAIRREIDLARQGHDVELALAARDRARAELAAARQQDYLAATGWQLARTLEAELYQRSLPPVLERARQLLARITRDRYELRMQPGEPPAFAAFDRADQQPRALSELSTATRLHLLLAVRLAFVEHQEAGLALPLFLDEALATSDERRARALIEAVAELAHEGRQVFCFTAQEAEVGQWLEVLTARPDVPHRLLRLGADTATPASRPAARALAWDRLPVPPPAGASHEEYGQRLRVPAVDPWLTEPGELHLWYLLEEPTELARFLAAGYERWGPTRALAERGGAEAIAPGSAATLARAAVLVRGLEAALAAFRVGRGRPVDRTALAASGLISETYFEPLAELAQALDGNAAALLAELRRKDRDARLKGFRREKVDELEAFFEQQGLLDRRAPKSAEEIRLEAVLACRADLEAGRLDLPTLERALARLRLPAPAPA